MDLKPANIEQLIIKNCLAALKDIDKLTFRGYDFLYQASNFIAHYNVHGFKDYYQQEGEEVKRVSQHGVTQVPAKSGGEMLALDIVRFQRDNQWRNFTTQDRDYEYMMQKKRIYNTIADAARAMYKLPEAATNSWGW